MRAPALHQAAAAPARQRRMRRRHRQSASFV